LAIPLLLVFLLLAAYRPADLSDALSSIFFVADYVFALAIVSVAAMIGSYYGSAAAARSAAEPLPHRIVVDVRRAVYDVGAAVAVGTTIGLAVDLLLDVFTGWSDMITNLSTVGRSAPVEVEASVVFSSGLLDFPIPFSDVVDLVVGVLKDPMSVFELSQYVFTGVGMIIGLIVGIGDWLKTPVMTTRAVTPRVLLKGDRDVIGVSALVVGATIGLMTIPAAIELTTGAVAFVLLVALAASLFVAVRSARNTAWAQYRVAHLALAVHGQLPWRLMTFLADARHAGILRQLGAVYQFRHISLQTHLAAEYRELVGTGNVSLGGDKAP
jgi:hypothetical protein